MVKVVLDEDAERIEVVVPDQQLSLAIGRKGQNVRLASQLTGWDIDIMTEASESERRQAEFAERSATFMEALDVDEVIAQLLASEGFSSVEEVAFVEPAEIASIEGFDEETAGEIQTRAREHLEKLEAELDAKRKELGVAGRLLRARGLNTAMLVALGENDVKTVEDLADCATDDLAGWSERKDKETTRHAGFLDGFGLTRPQCEDLILAARVKAGWIDEADLVPTSPRRKSPRMKAMPRHTEAARRIGESEASRQRRACGMSRLGAQGGCGWRRRSKTRRDRSAAGRGHRPRRCALTRAHRPKDDLIRFVLGPDGTVVPDLKERLPAAGCGSPRPMIR